MVLSEELCILASFFWSPMSRSSVVEKLRVKRFLETLKTLVKIDNFSILHVFYTSCEGEPT